MERLASEGSSSATREQAASDSAAADRVYLDFCDTWVLRAVSDRVLPLILESMEAGTRPRAAALEIDARLREEFGAQWGGDAPTLQRGIRNLHARKRARDAVRRIGPTLTRLVPDSLAGWLSRFHRPLALYVASARYRRKYGGNFVWKIHEEDDLLHYALDVVGAEPAFRYFHAAKSYFEGGEWNTAEVEKVLADLGVSLRDSRSLLEFASGYGRVTRHLVHTVDPSRITVSDIDRRGVDFSIREFGVRGFYSAGSPDEVDHDGRYDLIVVVSLFSHLPIDNWGPWLERMNEWLEPGGILMFSVGGMHAWNVNVAAHERDAFETKAEGFHYRERNETRGRLSTDQYGISYVSEQFVGRAVAQSFAGRLRGYFPRALNGFQDVYVLQRDDAAAG